MSLGFGCGKQPACIGIDGCRGGWVWCGRLDGRWQGGVAERLHQLDWLGNVRLALIDMPIGLVSRGEQERRCDREARALLSRPRASSVFRPPCRAALEAPDYVSACALNRAHTGVALSKQTWNLSPKIRELDQFLAARRGLRRCLREAHPELCLWGLAGGRSMQHNKRTTRGQQERLGLLRDLDQDCMPMIDSLERMHLRRILALDDIIDAAVLALTAAEALCNGIRCLPPQAELDDRGLPMQLLFVSR
ncbi:MAG: DUF429 domain-containing protein [Thiohalocapsa sp.]